MHIRPHGAVASPQRVYDICTGERMGGWGVSGAGGEGRGGEGRGGGWGRVERGCLLFVVCWCVLVVCVGVLVLVLVLVCVCVCLVCVCVCWWCVGGVCVWTSHVIPYLTQENECPPGRAGVRP